MSENVKSSSLKGVVTGDQVQEIFNIAKKHKLYVLEDCAHATGSKYKGRPAGAGWPRWTIPVLVAVLVGTLLLHQVWPTDDGEKRSFTEFVTLVENDEVVKITVTNGSNAITGELKDGSKFTTTVRDNFPLESDKLLLEEHGVDVSVKAPDSNWLLNWSQNYLK